MFYHIKPVIFPILLNFILFVGCLGPYIQALKEGTVTKDKFPFISDTGSSGIAAAIFSLFFSMFTFVLFIFITWRFEQVNASYRYRDHKCLNVANIVTYIIGLVTCVGLCLVANFREVLVPTALLDAHMSGTCLTFGCGLMYFILQSIFSFLWKNVPGSRLCINIFRACTAAANTVLVIAFAVELEKFMNTSDMNARKISAILEWTSAFSLTFNALTFIPEFYKLELKLVVKNAPSDRPDNTDNNSDSQIDNFPRLFLHGSTSRLREEEQRDARLVDVDETQTLLNDDNYTSDDNMLL